MTKFKLKYSLDIAKIRLIKVIKKSTLENIRKNIAHEIGWLFNTIKQTEREEKKNNQLKKEY